MSNHRPDSNRQPDSSRGSRVFVAGGDVAGLSTGLALHENGHTVSVFGPLHHEDVDSAGQFEEPTTTSGIVVEPSVSQFLAEYGVVDAAATRTTASEYRYLAPDGSIEASFGTDIEFTANDTLRTHLRNALPETSQHPERTIEQWARRSAAGATGDEVHVTDSAGEQHSGDLLVAADGWLSPIRQRALPSVTPTYAGYVSWHGILEESAVPRDLAAQFEDALTVSRGDRDLLTAMVLPGPDGANQSGARRLHWVWYTPVADRELGAILTDRHGTNRDKAVPPGAMQDRFATALRERAAEHAPALTRLVRATRNPGVQPVVDLSVPSAVLGRTAFVGDAAFTTRHHTAASTPKAIEDATSLADALDRYDDIGQALDDWASTQEVRGRQLVEQGRLTDLDRLIGRA